MRFHFLALSLLAPLSWTYASVSPEALFNAAKAGQTTIVQRALAEGAVPNARNEDGYTALIYAAYYGHEATVQALLQAGADPCLSDAKGNNALQGAIFKGFTSIALRLMDRCDVNARNLQGQTPLMYASLFGREEIARKLIEKGARTDLKDLDGRDAVSLAEGQWNQIMVKILKTTGMIRK